MTTSCPACSGKRLRKVSGHVSVFECVRCEALFGTCYLGESYELVLPRWHRGPETKPRYYEFTTLGSEGVGRRHGWFEPTTRCITQTG
jgi:hypothetical protein